MLIAHAYYTAGMHELAKIFVESFSYFHRENKTPLIIHAISISEEQQADLILRYPYISIIRKWYDIKEMAERCGVGLGTMKKWKRQIEKGYVTNQSRAWKLMIAGEDRIKCVAETLDMIKSVNPEDDQPLLLHFDIDTLFRGSILSIENEMKGYDVGLKLRQKIQPLKAKITIDCMALKPVPNTALFMMDWLDIIYAEKPINRPIGFGQSSCWFAYEKAIKENRLNAMKLPLEFGLPGKNQNDNIVWCGNVHKLRKEDCVRVFQDELNRMKEQNFEY